MARQQEPTLKFKPETVDERARGEQRFGEAPAVLQHSTRKPSGYVVVTDPTYGDTPMEAETLMCVHCQFHWIVKPGSGISRGFCLRCNGPTCGKELCETRCLPFEKALELARK